MQMRRNDISSKALVVLLAVPVYVHTHSDDAYCNNGGDPVYDKHTFIHNEHCQPDLKISDWTFSGLLLILWK
jgi:hypothetical protein